MEEKHHIGKRVNRDEVHDALEAFVFGGAGKMLVAALEEGSKRCYCGVPL